MKIYIKGWDQSNFNGYLCWDLAQTDLEKRLRPSVDGSTQEYMGYGDGPGIINSGRRFIYLKGWRRLFPQNRGQRDFFRGI